MFSEEDILHHDMRLDPDTEYFLYVGELKTDCLNPFLADALNRIFNKKFDFISILPDVLACYPHPNILVINPRSRALTARDGRKVSCRLSGCEFNRRVSASVAVQEMIGDLLARQGRLFVHVFESLPELTLSRIPGVTVLGPRGDIAYQWNSKPYQLTRLQHTGVPVIDFRICSDFNEMQRVTENRLPENVMEIEDALGDIC